MSKSDTPATMTPPGWAPEFSLLLLSGRTQFGLEHIRRAAELSQNGIDWKKFQDLTDHHRVTSLSYFLLGQIPGVPAPILAHAQGALHGAARRNLLLTGKLLQILALLKEHGIKAVAFKGPMLAQTVYGNLGLREFYDVDLLTRREDLPRVIELLRGRGYKTSATEDNPEHIPSQLGLTLHEPGGLILELHWALLQKWLGYGCDPAEIWNRLEPATLAGVSVETLPPTDLLLYLCAHGAKHCWEKLFWVVDLAEFLRVHPQLNWDLLRQQANERGSLRVLWLGLGLARTLLGAALPESIQTEINRDPHVRQLVPQIISWMAGNRQPPEEGSWEESLFLTATKERWSSKLAYHWHLAKLLVKPSPKDRAFIALPSALSWLYLLVRPVRVTRDRLHQRPE